MRDISKPLDSRYSCSRLSTHLAWGNISPRQVYLFVRYHPQYHKQKKRDLSAFLTRLKWRSHFIQKLEDEVSYEDKCNNSGFEKLEWSDRGYLKEAWEKGETGVPLVDACMRCLWHTGYINFRMRAMLVSFFCHHLDQDWRRGTDHLAWLFLDYEPGIHFTQFQMQVVLQALIQSGYTIL